jgi:hypothetical protein
MIYIANTQVTYVEFTFVSRKCENHTTTIILKPGHTQWEATGFF